MIFKRKSNSATKQIAVLEEIPAELEAYRIPFKIGDSLVESAKAYLNACREQLQKLHAERAPASLILNLNSLYKDDLIKTLFERTLWLFQETHPGESTKLAVMTLGGYGRQEMNVFSDIDLLFVYENKPDEFLNALTDSILYVLWDSGLEVGHAARSVKECRKMMEEDVTILTSLLDARYLAGDAQIGGQLLETVREQIKNKSIIKLFVEGKQKEKQDRLKRFGGSVYILEPNVKESEGGLRDFHLLLWYAKVFSKFSNLEDLVTHQVITPESLQELYRARDFLWQVRNAIHFRTLKKSDQLTFQYQEEIAKELGFQESSGVLAVEKFMQTYYHHAANIRRISSLAIVALVEPPEKRLKSIQKKISKHLNDDFALVEGKIFAKNPQCFQKDPLNLVRIFRLAQIEGADLEEETCRLISANLSLIDEKYIQKPEVGLLLRELFGEFLNLGRTLHQMHELRVLDRLIPEFGEVLYRVQHDAYHIYTVDTHSIVAMEEMTRLKNGTYDQQFPLFKEVLGKTSRHDLLGWGVFFHDVGKGRGKNHSIVGAEMAARAAERLGYSDKDREAIEFLVKSHLLMPHLAQRRDLDDANLIIQFAKSMQDLETLNMLFLLTWADIRAVGPDVWTPWKGTLLSELYNRTKRVLEEGTYTRERADRLAIEVREKVLFLLQNKPEAKEAQIFLEAMPIKYFLSYTAEEIANHARWVAEAGLDEVMVHIGSFEKENLNELTLHVFGTPALLAKITGVLAANDLNILEIKQQVSKKGWVLQSVRFTDSQGIVVSESRRFDLLKKDLFDVLEGRVKVAHLISSRKKPQWFAKKLAQTLPNRVDVDNDVSAYYTVIDLYTYDRIGLLYEVFTALSNLGLYVDVSKISTKVDQVADVFYVKDIFGQKITQSDKLKRIQAELLRVVEGEPS